MSDKRTHDLPKEFGEIPEHYFTHSQPKYQISKAVHDRMEERSMSVEELAQKAELAEDQVVAITAGDEYSIEELLSVCAALGLSCVVQ